MNASDLRALRNPLTALLIVIALGAGAIYYLNQTLVAARQELSRQNTQMREARTRLQKSGEEKQVIVRYLGDYQSLQKLGFVGDEQRLNWLEGLRLSNQQAQLFGINYQISAQQTYPYAAELDPGQLTLYQSEMKLGFNLLHEGDLMRFLNALAQQGAGFFSVRECKLDRLGSGGSVRFQPNLHAQCSLDWITLRAPPLAGDGKS
jgi:uncharacterized coiled-coil protein SlyX